MSDRRSFIRNAAFATAGIAAFPIIMRGGTVSANDSTTVGLIGCKGQGWSNLRAFLGQPGVVCAALCDVDRNVLEERAVDVEKLAGYKPKMYGDFRKLLEMKDIDAVIVATPDHWHAPAAIMALQAGKHVYLEKPTSHSPAENELLIRAAAKYNKIVQVGNQRRSWPNVIKGIEDVQNGTIGNVYYGKGWYTNNRPSIGIGKVVPVPDWLNWDLWQGPAPRVKNFKDNFVHYHWHWFWH